MGSLDQLPTTPCVGDCGDAEAAAPVCGNSALEVGEQCDDSNTVSGDGCSSTCRTEVKPPQPRVIAPMVLQGLRISGETDVHPSAMTQNMMIRDGSSIVRGSAKLCVGTDGGVASVAMLRSTGYGDYDAALLAAIRAWRYRPYLFDGVPVAACSAVTFIYSVK